MNKTQRDDLRRLAEAASKGPWTAHNENALCQWLVYPPYDRLLFPDRSLGPDEPQRFPLETNENNARYIAVANPAAILALLDRMEKLEKVAEAAKYTRKTLEYEYSPRKVEVNFPDLVTALSALGEVQDDDA